MDADHYMNVLYSPSNLNKYYTEDQYCGAVIGPIANRIKDGLVKLENEYFQLERNEGLNTLHSASKGLHRHSWSLESRTENSAVFSTSIQHLEDQLPGNRTITAEYSLSKNKLQLDLKMTTDRSTPANLSFHPFFKLDRTKSLDNHFFQINAEQYLSIDKAKLPDGRLLSVEQSIYDFRKERQLPDDVIDHNFICPDPSNIHSAKAIVSNKESNLQLKLYSTSPGLQFYTGRPHCFAMEAQHFPDSLNHPDFPPILIDQDHIFEQTIVFEIS